MQRYLAGSSLLGKVLEPEEVAESCIFGTTFVDGPGCVFPFSLPFFCFPLAHQPKSGGVSVSHSFHL